jgi:GNAT superfamily N-acetyltransferase
MINASDTALLLLAHELNAFTLPLLLQETPDVHITEYDAHNIMDLKGIERIMGATIFINNKKFPYSQLLRINAQGLKHIYNMADDLYHPPAYSKHPSNEFLYAQEIKKGGKRFMAKNNAGEIVGFGFVIPFNEEIYRTDFYARRPGYSEWIVTILAVDPNYRRLGIGRKLYDHMADWAKDQLKKMNNATGGLLHIECDKDNQPACAAYRKWTENNCKPTVLNDIICTKSLCSPTQKSSGSISFDCIVS